MEGSLESFLFGEFYQLLSIPRMSLNILPSSSQSNHESFQPICHKMRELVSLRSQILSGNLPADEMKEIKLLATSVIDTGNKLLGLDMVVRNEDGNVLDINSTATTQLYERHMNASDRIRRAAVSGGDL